MLLGAAAVAAALLLGVVVGPGETPLDRTVGTTLGRWCTATACRTASEALAVERGPPFGVWATVALPFVVVGGLLLAARGRPGAGARALVIRWLLVVLAMVPVHEVLSRLYGRGGPLPEQPGGSGLAYPSGAALLVAAGWLGAGVVVARLRPGWRRAWWVSTAAALLVHALVRVATGKHWVTDIAGSYLLAAGALAIARGLGRAGSS